MKKILQLLFPQHETSSLKVTWNFVVLFIWTNSRLAGQLSCTRVTGFFWAGCGGLSTYVLRCPLSQLRLILNQTLGLKPCRFGSGCCMAYTLKQAPCLLFCRGGLDAGLVNWLVSLWKSWVTPNFQIAFTCPMGCPQNSVLSTATFIRRAPFSPAVREGRTCWQQYGHKAPGPRTNLCYQPFLGSLDSSHRCSFCLILPHPGPYGAETLSWNNKL